MNVERRAAAWNELRVLWAAAAVMSLAACAQPDAHSQGHGEGDGHDYHHSEEHPAGHDHHAEAHGHAGPVVRVTRWTDAFELFMEHGVPLVGQPLSMLAHVTVLDGFRPLVGAAVELRLSGPSVLSARAETPTQPGIYALSLVPKVAGRYQAELRIDTKTGPAVIDGFSIQVYADAEAGAEAGEHHDVEQHVSFLKEQQWKVDFATAFVGRGQVAPVVEVPGTVTTPPGGSAVVSAPIAGRVVAPAFGLPRPGQRVRKGDLLANLSPAPASAEGAARAKLSVVESDTRLRAAEVNLARAERLIADEAISLRELEDARRELSVAREAASAAGEVAQLFAGARSGAGGASWRITAPIAGVLVTSHAHPGAAVSPDEVLFRIVDRSELWLSARVPEQDAARLRPERAGSYQVAGLASFQPLRPSGETPNASLVAVAPLVDPATRSVEVIYALRDPEPTLRVGGLVTLALPAGEPFVGLVVPRAALVSAGGRSLVYVQLDGEHFEARQVRVALRAADRIGIEAGLSEGERIVTVGAGVVHLSAQSRGQQPHGHIH